MRQAAARMTAMTAGGPVLAKKIVPVAAKRRERGRRTWRTRGGRWEGEGERRSFPAWMKRRVGPRTRLKTACVGFNR
jgi:hypothetical protein